MTPVLDPEALNQFLTFLWEPDPNTLFSGVKTVPPGHFLQWRDDTITLTKWWDVSFDSVDEHHNEDW